MPDHIVLTVVVNGQPTEVATSENAELQAVVAKALEQTGNTGQPPENWELRNASGLELDVHKKVGDYHLDPQDQLFLNLKAGVGG